eukprot:GHVT01075863.1.p1 GENE.GHVT01075863.1~~GHVT01075863.1.p1  ORF type:complete len:110 (+),score=12.42 GHVT01075863.1:1271-1600(+)
MARRGGDGGECGAAGTRRRFRLELSATQREELKEAFDLFDISGTGLMDAKDLKVVLGALGFDNKRDSIKKLLFDLNKPDTAQDNATNTQASAAGTGQYYKTNSQFVLMR